MRTKLSISVFILCIQVFAYEGIPFLVNYPSGIYKAHNRNFDVVCDTNGVVWFANFEGILRYDNAEWTTIHTPEYSRITRLFIDSKNKLWAGGYNTFGYIDTNNSRSPIFKPLYTVDGENRIGEITDIIENNHKIYIFTTSGMCYDINDFILISRKGPSTKKTDLNAANHPLTLTKNLRVIATNGQGIIISNSKHNKPIYITETNGLCSNNINRIATDYSGTVWGATDNAIFSLQLPSPFSRYTRSEGLLGEVVTLMRHNSQLYAGTLRGLFVLNGNTFTPIASITQACWSLAISPQKELFAATAEGLFIIDKLKATKITDAHTLSITFTEDFLYLGKTDSISQLTREKGNFQYIKTIGIPHVIHLSYHADSTLRVITLHGEVYNKKRGQQDFIRSDIRAEVHKLEIIHRQSRWTTDWEGKNITLHADSSKVVKKMNEKLRALQEKNIRVIYPESDSLVWLGGDFGIIRVEIDDTTDDLPQVFIRKIRLQTDSIYYGNTLPDDCTIRDIQFSFSATSVSPIRETQYRYMLEGFDKHWQSWTTDTRKMYSNLRHGSYTFLVQAKDAFDRYSNIQSFSFVIQTPFYLKWYSFISYSMLLLLFIWIIMRWRMRRLIKEKQMLEEIVDERTSQLREAQAVLIRQEKMATVGKLTKGLIDRILNPLNYINNFSRLSTALINDLRAHFLDEKSNLPTDISEESTDILDMLSSNLSNIGKHGESTTLILKAMEEVIRDRSGSKSSVDIINLCRKSIASLHEYYRVEIAQINLSVNTTYCIDSLFIYANEEQLRKTIMSLFNNAIYAIKKKYEKGTFSPILSLIVQVSDHKEVHLRIRDNGIGIEETIMELIFDPFFTTKVTGEAAGVGLYLSKEIIANHNGTLTVESVKNDYTEFLITLPIITQSNE